MYFFNFRNTGDSCDEAERLTYDCIGSVEEATLLSDTRQDDVQITVQNIDAIFTIFRTFLLLLSLQALADCC